MVNAEKSVAFPIGPHSHAKVKSCDIAPFVWTDSSICNYLDTKVPTQKIHIVRTEPQFDMHSYVVSITATRDSKDDNFFGRKHNIQAFVGSKFNYYLSLAPTSTLSYLNKVQSLINNYIWASGHHYLPAN